MMKPVNRLSIVLLLSLLLLAGHLQAQTVPVPMPAEPSIAAPAYILVEFDTMESLVERDADARWEPASLVKVMTAYVVFSEIAAGRLSLDQQVTVSEQAWRMGGSRMFIEVGEQVSVEDLIRGMIIQSGNDASVALAEHVAGTEQLFAQMMNAYAEQLGMTNTRFTNATGWPDPEQYTTARDMAILARAMIDNHRQHYGYYAEREFTYNAIRQSNRNRLLWMNEGVDGLKTGHTSSAGYNLVTSAEREGMRLVSVVLGTDGPEARVSQTRSLLNYGFRFFRPHRFHEAGEVLQQARIWRGTEEQLAIGLLDPITLVVPQRLVDSIQTELSVTEPLMAPIAAGDPVGELVLRGLGGEVLHRQPLVALTGVGEAGLFGRLWDWLMLRFE